MVRRSIPEINIDNLSTSTAVPSKDTVPVDLALDEQNSYRFSEENTQ